MCHLADKKVDREWSEWEYRAYKKYDEYFEDKTRDISIDFAHGGNPGENESSIILEQCRTFQKHVQKRANVMI